MRQLSPLASIRISSRPLPMPHRWRARHVLDTTCDVDISVAQSYAARRVHNCAHSGGAEAIYSLARDRCWKSREQERHSRDVAVVFSGLIGASENDIGDCVSRNIGISLDEILDD